jgi:pilus assembly protein FimV
MSPMAIKLHLASAYQDIGDKEGASLLLEEVIQDGTSEQSQQAKSMLDKLA